jgi:hypothetical protein
VTEPASPPAPPAWVTKRDGRLVPFEADKISRALFAATEELGRPDAFLARELTDSVVHFLTAEAEAIPSTAQVADLVVKVVRELGQPALAAAFANGQRGRRPRVLPADADVPEPAPLAVRFSASHPLPAVLDDCVRQYTLRRVFARDLVAAHHDGLLTLGGLDAPFELAGCVLAPPADPAHGVVETVEDARSLAGNVLALDGPEHLLLGTANDATAGWARELGIGLRATGLAAVVNLNVATPPPWADDLAEGPLFATRRAADPRLPTLADALLERLLQPGPTRDRLRVDWHLGEHDFQPGTDERLLRVARRVLAAEPLAFVFDRSRRPVALAEGLDRQHPGVLLGVRVHLPRLLAQPGVNGDAERFLHKLGSLARLALSAAVQKRDFLRRHRPALGRGFLLERARLVVTPEGLGEVVCVLAGGDLPSRGPALEFARRVLQRLRDVLRQDGLACRIATCLDAAPGVAPVEGEAEPPATVKQLLRTAGSLHAVAEGGTAQIILAAERPPSAEQIADWLRWAWHQTDVNRLRFLRAAPKQQQLIVPWPEP